MGRENSGYCVYECNGCCESLGYKNGIDSLKMLRETRGYWCKLWTRVKGDNWNRRLRNNRICFIYVLMVIIFYKNDLGETPRKYVEGYNDFTIRCVDGLVPLQRGIGNEEISRTTLEVPSCIVE